MSRQGPVNYVLRVPDSDKEKQKTLTVHVARMKPFAFPDGKYATDSLIENPNCLFEAEEAEEKEVAAIRDHKIERGIEFMLVKWKDKSEQSSWEQSSELRKCQEMVNITESRLSVGN